MNVSVENKIGKNIWVLFFKKTNKYVTHKPFQNLLTLESKEIGLWFEQSNFESFLSTGIILLFFKIEGNNPEEKELVKKECQLVWHIFI